MNDICRDERVILHIISIQQLISFYIFLIFFSNMNPDRNREVQTRKIQHSIPLSCIFDCQICEIYCFNLMTKCSNGMHLGSLRGKYKERIKLQLLYMCFQIYTTRNSEDFDGLCDQITRLGGLEHQR